MTQMLLLSKSQMIIIVGHLSRKISLVCQLYLELPRCTIDCEVVSVRRYSSDLLQGGVEVLCLLDFHRREELSEATKANKKWVRTGTLALSVQDRAHVISV